MIAAIDKNIITSRIHFEIDIGNGIDIVNNQKQKMVSIANE